MSTEKNKRMAEKHWKWTVGAQSGVSFSEFQYRSLQKRALTDVWFLSGLQILGHYTQSWIYSLGLPLLLTISTFVPPTKRRYVAKKPIFVVQVRFCNDVKCVLQVLKIQGMGFHSVEDYLWCICDIQNRDIYCSWIVQREKKNTLMDTETLWGHWLLEIKLS